MSTSKKILCALWLAVFLSGCSGTTGNVPDSPSADIEPSVAISTPTESAPIAEPQETTIPTESGSIVEEYTEESAEPSAKDTLDKDISVFAGVYAMYDQPLFDCYGYPPTIALEDNGRISGQILSGKVPIYVNQNDNGTLTCMISEGEQKFDEAANMFLTTQPKEFYVICPAGVTSGFNDYPDYDYLGTDIARIRYIVIDGGAIDIMYYKIS